MKPKATNFPFYKPHHEEEKIKLENFIKEFTDNELNDPVYGKKKYMIELVKRGLNDKIKIKNFNFKLKFNFF